MNLDKAIKFSILSLFLVVGHAEAASVNKSHSSLISKVFTKVTDPLEDKNYAVHIRYHFYGTYIAPDSFDAKLKEKWRVGYKFMKTTESYSPQDNIHQETIVNEPDAWIVDLVSKKGKHMVDPENGKVHDPILPDQPQTAKEVPFILEFGNEFAFMQKNHAKKLNDEVVLGVKVHHYYLEFKNNVQNDIVDLYTDPQYNHPIKLEISRINPKNQEKYYVGIMYESYDDTQTPDYDLFRVDPEFKIIDIHQ